MTFFDKIGWSPGIGDPSIMGWLTVAIYITAGVYALKVFRDSEYIFSTEIILQKYFWLVICSAMFFLAINKQLDLQTFFTAWAKYFAKQQDWYSDRRKYQKLFIYTIFILSILLFVFLAFLFRRVYKNQFLALIGISFLFAFIFVRASSFHHMDQLISSKVFGLKMNWILELSGISLLLLNAHRLLNKKRSIFEED